MNIDMKYVRIVLRWAWLFILAAGLAGAASYWVGKQQPTVYEARARLIVGPGIDSPNPDLNALRTGSQLMQTYAKLATTRPVLEAVINELGLETTPEILKKTIRIKTDQETQILTVVVEDTDPIRAANIANAEAEMLVRLSSAAVSTRDQVREQIVSEIARLEEIVSATEARIRELEAELAALEEEEANPDPELQEIIQTTENRIKQLEELLRTTQDITAQQLIQDQITRERARLFEIQQARDQQRQFLMNQLTQERARLTDAHRTLAQLYASLQESTTNQVKIVAPAVTGYPAASQLRLRALMGAVGGLILALFVVLAFEYLDTSIQDEKDLERAAGVPMLGSIAAHRTLTGSGQKRLIVQAHPDSQAAENYRMLGTKLQFASQSNNVRTVMLSSTTANDATTGELALNLAAALAEMGSRVILVDANVRYPTLSTLLGLPEETPGLTDMLTEDSQTPVATRVEWLPELAVVPTGPVSAESFKLLASARMTRFLECLQEQADFVLVVAPPLLAFADSLILASRVDGVVLVAYKGETLRESVGEAVRQLHSLGVHVVGAVLSYKTLIQRRMYRPASRVRRLRKRVSAKAMKGHPSTSDQPLTLEPTIDRGVSEPEQERDELAPSPPPEGKAEEMPEPAHATRA